MKNKKISYILPTRRQMSLAYPVIDALFRLPPHDFELIIACHERFFSEELLSNNQIKLVKDTSGTGACNPANDAYKISDGDYICLMSDDIMYPQNFLDIIPWMESDNVQKRRFKLANIMWDGGADGIVNGEPIYLWLNGHDDLEDGKWHWPSQDPIIASIAPYSYLIMPFVERETMEKEFAGHLFPPEFRHHYGDHWMGLYVSKNETFNPFCNWRCPTIKYIPLAHLALTNANHDTQDLNTFHSFCLKWKNNHNVSYLGK